MSMAATDGIFSAVHMLFEAQVSRMPGATAVRMDGLSLTYAALDAAANRLASALRARGVGRRARVGALLQRSGDLAVALLGILKAGSCYVPLDPDFPATRLRFMAADAELAACIVAGRAPGFDLDVPILDVRQSAELPSPSSSAPPSFRADPEDLAYIIYTSGSTGHPKGVA